MPGLVTFALATDGARREVVALRAAGSPISDAIAGSRARPDGEVGGLAVRLPARARPGRAAVPHRARAERARVGRRRPDAPARRSSTRSAAPPAWSGIELVVPDPAATAAAYASVVGVAVPPGAGPSSRRARGPDRRARVRLVPPPGGATGTSASRAMRRQRLAPRRGRSPSASSLHRSPLLASRLPQLPARGCSATSSGSASPGSEGRRPEVPRHRRPGARRTIATHGSPRPGRHEHHDRLIPHVDQLARLAGMIDEGITPEFLVQCEAEHRFIVGQLLPHMEAIETTLYGELDRLMEGRHSMAPMRREHAELRRLIDADGPVPRRRRRRGAWGLRRRSGCAGPSTGSTPCCGSTWPRRSSTCGSWTATSPRRRRTSWPAASSTRWRSRCSRA